SDEEQHDVLSYLRGDAITLDLALDGALPQVEWTMSVVVCFEGRARYAVTPWSLNELGGDAALLVGERALALRGRDVGRRRGLAAERLARLGQAHALAAVDGDLDAGALAQLAAQELLDLRRDHVALDELPAHVALVVGL